MPARAGQRAVALVSDSTAWGGAERYLEQLCTRMAERSFQPRIALFDHPAVPPIARRYAAAGIPTDVVPVTRTSSALQQFMAWRRYFAHDRPALVHINRTDAFGFVMAQVAARAAGVRTTVMMEHLPTGCGPPHPAQSFRALRRFGVRRTAMIARRRLSAILPAIVITGSRASKRVLCGDFCYPERRVAVIPNGVEVRPPPPSAARQAARAALGLAREAVLVGSVGRLAPQKGLDWLLREFRAASTRHPSARLCVVGDGECRSALEALSLELGLGHAVTFVGHHDDVSRWYAAFDIWVMLSRYESAPFALLEAMQAGLAIVASDIPPVREVFESEGASAPECGLLVPPLGEGLLADAVVSLIEQPERRCKLGHRARARVSAQFTIERCVSDTLDLYEGVLGACTVLG